MTNEIRKRVRQAYGMIIGMAMLLALSATQAMAIPKDFALNPYPDLTADLITFTSSYNNNNGNTTYEGKGFVEVYKDETGNEYNPLGFFNILFTVNNNNSLIDGSLDIKAFNPNPYSLFTLFTQLTDMWQSTAGGNLLFQFDPTSTSTSGTLASAYSTGRGGVIIGGDFKFDNPIGEFSSDVGLINAAVPEPGTVSLFLLGGAGMIAWRRRQTAGK